MAHLPESELAAVCDADRARAEAFASRYGGRPFQDVSKPVREGGAEAVFVCAPHPLHAEAGILAAQAGAHVLVEKPMAASLEDCDAMLRAARQSGVTLSVMRAVVQMFTGLYQSQAQRKPILIQPPPEEPSPAAQSQIP